MSAAPFAANFESTVLLIILCSEAFYRWRIIPRALVDTNTRDLTSTSDPTTYSYFTATHICVSTIQPRYSDTASPLQSSSRPSVSINYTAPKANLYQLPSPESSDCRTASPPQRRRASKMSPLRTTRPLKLGMRVTAFTRMMVRLSLRLRVLGESAHCCDMMVGPNGGNAKSPRFFQLYMGHDDEVTLSLLNRAWKSGFDVLMLTTDTWQLGWRPTDINIANYVYVSSLCLHLYIWYLLIECTVASTTAAQ